MEEPLKCLNCGSDIDNMCFCPQCGQRTNTSRINRKALGRSIVYSFFNADRGIWFTIKNLFTRPGRFINDYIRGMRIHCFPPFSILFISAALFALINQTGDVMTKIREKDNTVEVTQQAVEKVSEKLAEKNIPVTSNSDKTIYLGNDIMNIILEDRPLLKMVLDWMKGNYGIIILFALPLFVISVRLCFGKKFRHRFNGSETFIIGAYINSIFFVVMSFLGVISLIYPGFKETQNNITIFAIPAIIALTMKDLSGIKIGKSIWRSILSIIVFFNLVLFVIIALSIPVLYALNV